jgi:hypothetical protein
MRLFVLPLLAVVLHAQPEVSRIRASISALARQWIADSLPERRAWAAELSKQVADPSFGSELLRALGDPAAAGDRSLRLAILDALIQRGDRIPEETSLALLREYPAQAMILLYGHGYPELETNREVMRRAVSDEAWLLGAGAAAGQRGGPAVLVQTVDPAWVEDKKMPGGSPGGALGGIVRSPPPGWPLLADYELVRGARAGLGDVLLLGGSHAIYYQRHTVIDHSPEAAPWRGDRNRYTLDLLGDRVALPPGSTYDEVISKLKRYGLLPADFIPPAR